MAVSLVTGQFRFDGVLRRRIALKTESSKMSYAVSFDDYVGTRHYINEIVVDSLPKNVKTTTLLAKWPVVMNRRAELLSDDDAVFSKAWWEVRKAVGDA